MHNKALAPSIIEALTFFGPMTPTEIAEKLAMRKQTFNVVDITYCCTRYALNDGAIKFAKDLTRLPHETLFMI